MSIQTFTQYPINDTDAHFRAWGKAISDALTALGINKTADTGQIDWSTVSKPAGASTMQGYEIRVFSDSLQTTDPVYMKIQYGSGSAANNPALLIQLGQGSDGSGNLTGNLSSTPAAGATSSGSNSGTVSASSYVTGNSGGFSIILWPGHATTTIPFGLSVRRLKNDNGNDKAGGVTLYAEASTRFQQFLPTGAAAFPTTALTQPMCSAPNAGGGGYGSNLGFWPVLPYLGGSENPDLGAGIYDTGTISAGTVLDATLYGATHHFITQGRGSANVNGNSGTTFSTAWGYE